MKNVFENAYFGKAYKTRDGRKALYWRYVNTSSEFVHYLILSNESGRPMSTEDEIIANKEGKNLNIPYNKSYSDIVSEWQEEIDEKKLNNLARAEVNIMNVESSGIGVPNDHFPSWVIDFAEEAFKAGYREAKKTL